MSQGIVATAATSAELQQSCVRVNMDFLRCLTVAEHEVPKCITVHTQCCASLLGEMICLFQPHVCGLTHLLGIVGPHFVEQVRILFDSYAIQLFSLRNRCAHGIFLKWSFHPSRRSTFQFDGPTTSIVSKVIVALDMVRSSQVPDIPAQLRNSCATNS